MIDSATARNESARTIKREALLGVERFAIADAASLIDESLGALVSDGAFATRVTKRFCSAAACAGCGVVVGIAWTLARAIKVGISTCDDIVVASLLSVDRM